MEDVHPGGDPDFIGSRAHACRGADAGVQVMRVLYLTMNPNRESTTVPTEGWFRLLRDRGLEPVLVSSVSGAFQAWSKEQGIPCYEVPLPFPDTRRPWPFLKSLMQVARIARRHRVELVHCNEHDIYPIGQYVARLLRIPVVISVHFTLRDGFSRWAFGGARCPSRIFFISRGSLEACRPDVEPVIPESRWRILYNGLDMERFKPDPELRAAFRHEHGLGDLRRSAWRARCGPASSSSTCSRLPRTRLFRTCVSCWRAARSGATRRMPRGSSRRGARFLAIV